MRDDPGLNDNDDLGSYHEIIWGDDVNKYKYDPSKNNRGSEVPSVVYKNGKYHINDGRHRIKALANSGYEYIELPVLREMLLEDNDDNNSGEEEIKLTSHLNYPDMVYDYVFRVSWGRDTLAARFTKRDCKFFNVDGYPFTAAWASLNLKGGSQLSFLTSADAEEFLSENMFRSTNIYVSKSKQKVVRIDVNGKVPCYVGVDYLNSTYGDKEGYIHPVIQKRLDEATPTATPKLVWIHLSTYCDEDIELKVYNNIDEIVKDATNIIFKKLSAKAPWAEINEELIKIIISGGKKYTETKYLKISDLLS